MALRSGTVVMGWSAVMAGLVLAGIFLTTSGSQARTGASLTAAGGAATVADRNAAAGSAVGEKAAFGGDAPVERGTAESAPRSELASAATAVDTRPGSRFNALVHHLQSRDGVENTSPPFMWLASLAVSVARPAGVLDLRLATFEGRRLKDIATDGDFDALVTGAASDGWSPMVRVRSKRSQELVSIHARVHGDNVALLLVTVNKGEAVVAQMIVKPDTVAQWLKDPDRIESRFR